MNNPNYIEIIAAFGSFLSGIGLFATAASLFFLAKQTRANERATTASVYQSIVSMGDSINDMLIDKPELFEQIFGANSLPANITIDELQTKHIQQFYAAQKWLDYFEIILVTWPSIPEHLHKPWREYIKSYLGESPFLQFIVLNTQWYGSNLKQLCYEGINEKQKITQPVSPADPGPVASSV